MKQYIKEGSGKGELALPPFKVEKAKNQNTSQVVPPNTTWASLTPIAVMHLV